MLQNVLCLAISLTFPQGDVLQTTIASKLIAKYFLKIIHHIMKSKYTLECNQMYHIIKILSKEHTFKLPSNKFAQRYVRTTTLAECMTIPTHYLKNYTPMCEHGFLPFVNDCPFAPSPPHL